MGSTFNFQGSLTVDPSASSDPQLPVGIGAPLLASLDLSLKKYDEFSITDNATHTVNFGGLVNGANLVAINVVGSKITVRITSADGNTQSVPVDGFLLLISGATPITALDLTRTGGTATTSVGVTLGAK